MFPAILLNWAGCRCGSKSGKAISMDGIVKIDYTGICDIGKSRKINQDAIAMFSAEETGVFVAADGMGGHTDGEKASRIIVSEVTKWWQHFNEKQYESDFQKMLLSLVQAMEIANLEIYEKLNQGKICGSTATVLFLHKGNYGIIYAGDSRCYLYRKKKLKQLTMDEVWENQPELNLSEKNNASHPNRGKLVNAVGINPSLRYRVLTDKIVCGDVFLLCSDGLYKVCKERHIEQYISKCRNHAKTEISAEKMLQEVYQNGAGDNISFVIIRLYV